MLSISTENWAERYSQELDAGIRQFAGEDTLFLLTGKIEKLEELLNVVKTDGNFDSADIKVMEYELVEHQKQYNEIKEFKKRKGAVQQIIKKVLGQLSSDEDTGSKQVVGKSKVDEKIKDVKGSSDKKGDKDGVKGKIEGNRKKDK